VKRLSLGNFKKESRNSKKNLHTTAIFDQGPNTTIPIRCKNVKSTQKWEALRGSLAWTFCLKLFCYFEHQHWRFISFFHLKYIFNSFFPEPSFQPALKRTSAEYTFAVSIEGANFRCTNLGSSAVHTQKVQFLSLRSLIIWLRKLDQMSSGF